MKYFKKIEGDRVFLSPINLEDLEVYTKWMNDLSTTICLGNSAEVYSLMSENEEYYDEIYMEILAVNFHSNQLARILPKP